MKLSLAMMAAACFSLSVVAGCATDTDGGPDDDTEEVVGATAESDLKITPTRQAQLDALRARVTKDFAHPASLDGKKLVFVINRYKSNDTACVFFAHVMKRDIKTGKDAELTNADYKGSQFEERIKEGFFDGPEVIAVLEKSAGKWSIAKNSHGTGYVVGPTDVAFQPWPQWFGIPKSWFGL